MANRLDVLLEGLRFGEGPRWHEGRLWFSDMHDRRVIAVDLDGRAETLVETPHDCSGLGWLPDGRLLVVSMEDRKLLRLEPEGLVEAADLSSVATFHCNDMVVDAQGRAYVGNFGFDLHQQARPVPADLALAHPDGRVEVAAKELRFPNGTIITPDGHTLVVGESFGACLTAFDVGGDGRLSGRREWARLENAVPDGICLDAEGAIWVASPVSHEVLRVLEGGRVAARIAVAEQAYACMLGGPARRHLFVCTAATSDPKESHRRTGRIEVTEVEVPGAGLP
ncbi:MAG: SMP-30/gluconolactonase/LRE family protein [Myxococcota bacterium]